MVAAGTHVLLIEGHAGEGKTLKKGVVSTVNVMGWTAEVVVDSWR
jgi:hypothetical protein